MASGVSDPMGGAPTSGATNIYGQALGGLGGGGNFLSSLFGAPGSAQSAGMFGGLGGLAGGLYSLFGGGDTGDGGYGALISGLQGLEPTIKAGGERAIGYLNPYETVGRSALNEYFGQLNQAQNPEHFINNIMSHYQESPSVQFQKQQGIDALNTSAGARGLLGSGAQAKSLMQFGQGLASQGQQQYLQNVLGLRGQTLAGLGGLGQMGQQAATQQGAFGMEESSQLANLMSQIAQAQAKSQQYQQQQQAQQSSSGLGDLLGGVSSLASLIF